VDDPSNPTLAAFELFRRRVFTESVDIVEFATVPIAFVKDGKVTPDRTGILLAIGDNHFVLTAEHDLEEIYNLGYIPFIAAASPTGQPTPLLHDRMVVSHDSKIDIAVFRLDHSVVNQLKAEYRFLRLNDLRLWAPTEVEGPFFLVTGFPSSLETIDEAGRRKLDVSRYLTLRYDGDYDLVKDFAPTSHIVLEYSRDSSYTSGETGRPPKAPGLSGCGIWYLPTPHGLDAWTSQDIKLVGIQNHWHPYEYLKGTTIARALTMIWRWFSDVRDVMRLNGIDF
jgi:hypothetical protein